MKSCGGCAYFTPWLPRHGKGWGDGYCNLKTEHEMPVERGSGSDCPYWYSCWKERAFDAAIMVGVLASCLLLWVAVLTLIKAALGD